ncbi:pyridoxal phosphate-dependent decarboxylase family protein [Mycoplana ramosa]|uniref:Pyridoxal phosphate-dependent decarboxylase family protein n=1 Tax=Mycoplana ramosa TaxID=40837 RepID=A0ABW3YTK3_MYCRA
MDIEALFRQAADEAARYRNSVPDRLHRPGQDYAAASAAFEEPLPEAMSEPCAILEALVARAEPGLHLMTGPRFFGWVIGGSHPVGVAADMLTSAWGQNAGNHSAAPAASAAEAISARWLLELLELPRESSVGFVTGATVANFTCLAAARGEVLRGQGWDVDAQGLFGAPPITVLIGDDAHTTVFSALQFLGLGRERVIRIATDEEGRVRPDAFVTALAAIEGPAIAIFQAGQINTGAFDSFAELIPAAKAKGAWVHVDGAFGLWARACPAKCPLAAGIEMADSWATDGHKWLQTPYDCGYAIVRDELAHRRAMTIAASYLPLAQAGERDPSHYVPELSRRARGFATWAMMKHLGRSGIAELVARNCHAAAEIARMLAARDGIRVLNKVQLNQVIVRFGDGLAPDAADRMTQDVVALLQKEGQIFAGGAAWRGRQVMRISVSNYQTDEDQAEIAAEVILAAYARVSSGMA